MPSICLQRNINMHNWGCTVKKSSIFLFLKVGSDCQFYKICTYLPEFIFKVIGTIWLLRLFEIHVEFQSFLFKIYISHSSGLPATSIFEIRKWCIAKRSVEQWCWLQLIPALYRILKCLKWKQCLNLTSYHIYWWRN